MTTPPTGPSPERIAEIRKARLYARTSGWNVSPAEMAIDELLTAYDAAVARAEGAMAVLRALEWGPVGATCPLCGAARYRNSHPPGTHHHGCVLEAALARERIADLDP